ncbi:MAG TPA: hypothetical protein VIV56_07285 [Gemmatimonadales bacterium]
MPDTFTPCIAPEAGTTDTGGVWGVYGGAATAVEALSAIDEVKFVGRRGLNGGVERLRLGLTNPVPNDVGFVRIIWYAKTLGTPHPDWTFRVGIQLENGNIHWSQLYQQLHAAGPTTFQPYSTVIDCTVDPEAAAGASQLWFEGDVETTLIDLYYLITYVTAEPVLPLPPTFPFEANGLDPIREQYGYLTDVLVARDRTEQRVQLRELSVGGIEYSLMALDPVETQRARRLIYTSQDQQLAIPLWQYGTRLTAAALPGDAVLELDTTDIPFGSAGDLVAIWRAHNDYELSEITSVDTTLINLSRLLVGGPWPVGTRVFPARRGRLASLQGFSWPAIRIGLARVPFTFDIPTPAAAPGSFTQYQGLDVLEVLPNRDRDIDYDIERKQFLLDSLTGKRLTDASEVAPVENAPFVWYCSSRADVAVLRGFLDARIGRAVPFWRPTLNADFTLDGAALAAATTLTVKSWGYAATVFPLGAARRHIAVRPPGGLPEYHKITAAVDNEDGTETLTITPGLALDAPADALVSFMLLCRLADDLADLEWGSGQFAECVLGLTELPRETPA